MPTAPARKVSLTPELSRFIDEMVAAGAYNSASEVVRDGLRELQRRKHADQLSEIQTRIGDGLETLDRGEGRTGAPAEVLGGILKKAKGRHTRRNS